MSVRDAFNWAAEAPKRPFTLMNEFNRLAGNKEYGGFKFGRAARIVDRTIMATGLLTVLGGAFFLSGGGASVAGVALSMGIIKIGATAVAALTDGAVKVGRAIANASSKKVGAGPSGPTPSP
jgi:hypothetical protein